MARDGTPATDGQRQEAVEAAEAVVAALECYHSAIDRIADELPSGRAILGNVALCVGGFREQVRHWRDHRANSRLLHFHGGR